MFRHRAKRDQRNAAPRRAGHSGGMASRSAAVGASMRARLVRKILPMPVIGHIGQIGQIGQCLLSGHRITIIGQNRITAKHTGFTGRQEIGLEWAGN